MVLKLFMTPTSPPVRSVLLTAKALGITLKTVDLDLYQKREHLTPEFIKLNPQHTVPTLEDDGAVIWDSHAINVYLVTKYGKDKSLYPEDPLQKAIINQRLHFDSGILFTSLVGAFRSIGRQNAKSIPPEAIEIILEGYSLLEKFLEGHQFVAGDTLTLADLHIVASISSLDVLVPIDANKFPNISVWYRRMEALPFYEANVEGLNKMREKTVAILKS